MGALNIYQVSIVQAKENMGYALHLGILEQTLKILNMHKIININKTADIGCYVFYREQNLVPYAINYCFQGLLIPGK